MVLMINATIKYMMSFNFKMDFIKDRSNLDHIRRVEEESTYVLIFSLMGLGMKVSGLKESIMAMEGRFLKVVPCMKDSGIKT